jgi:hypothetical protein
MDSIGIHAGTGGRMNDLALGKKFWDAFYRGEDAAKTLKNLMPKPQDDFWLSNRRGPNMRPDNGTDDSDIKEYEYHEYDYDGNYDTLDDADRLKVGKSMADDIDDRINNEFMSPSVGVTAQSNDRKRFRVIPEE